MKEFQIKGLVSSNTEIRFDSSECDITNNQVSCYSRVCDSFDISLSGFEVLEDVFENIMRGEKIKKGDVYVRIYSNAKCSLCYSRDKCLSLSSLTNKNGIEICERCISLARDMCKLQSENLVRYNEVFKVLSFSEEERFHDIIENEVLDIELVLVVEHCFYVRLSNVRELAKSLENPLDYECVSKVISKDYCNVCGEKSEEFVCYHRRVYICENCRERICSSLNDYIEENTNEMVSLKI